MQTLRVRTPRSVLLTALLAVVVVAGALIAVMALRPRPDAPAATDPAAASPPVTAPAEPSCGPGPCDQLAAQTVGGVPVILLAAPTGKFAQLRIGTGQGAVVDLTITGMGATLSKESLRCVDGASASCLIRGDLDGGAVGDVVVNRGGTWRGSGRPYLADAGNISLSDVTGDGTADVIVVRHECPGAQSGSPKCQAAPVLAEVYDLAGTPIGCTKKYTSPSQLKGWPEVRLTKPELRACP
ncbi:hypothetical protein [Amycolatopsis sp. H20-H5]|uniref:hypothetical protein n=1 Tax=Amycolatopsis sp. H20-H5 TaxID=3046309 RepID=UPI002DB6D16A|nr:hypothetical protein [Amycolatopsis sp. H20-H5]MEC3978126.1 hypothetical protein [Amycolatopsis sp. H20-H5]